jgi:hypothetical protein
MFRLQICRDLEICRDKEKENKNNPILIYLRAKLAQRPITKLAWVKKHTHKKTQSKAIDDDDKC